MLGVSLEIITSTFFVCVNRKIKNTVLELHDEEGHVVRNFKDLEDLSTFHFGKIFTEVNHALLER